MYNITEILEEEFKAAILKQDERAIKTVSIIIGPAIEKMKDNESDIKEIKSDIKEIAEMLKLSIENTNKRFEDMQRQIDRLYRLFIFSTSFITSFLTAVILIVRFLFPS